MLRIQPVLVSDHTNSWLNSPGPSFFKHQPAPSHQERPPVKREAVEVNNHPQQKDETSMYHIFLKNFHVVALQRINSFLSNLEPNHQPLAKKCQTTSQIWGFIHDEVFLHVLPKSSAAFAGVWTKAPGVCGASVFWRWSQNCDNTTQHKKLIPRLWLWIASRSRKVEIRRFIFKSWQIRTANLDLWKEVNLIFNSKQTQPCTSLRNYCSNLRFAKDFKDFNQKKMWNHFEHTTC